MIKTLYPKHKVTSVPITYNSLGHIKEVEKHGKFFEYGMLEAIEKLPYRPGICMDIGANVGNHTVFFSKFCKFDDIHSYEPFNESFVLLCDNLSKNNCSNVWPHFFGISSKRGYVIMDTDKKNPSWNKIDEKTWDKMSSDYPNKSKKNQVHAKLTTITTKEKVALMKIDVEGHELEVIKGAYEVIEREKPELFIEWHDGYEPILNSLPKGYRYVKTYNNAPSHHFTAKL